MSGESGLSRREFFNWIWTSRAEAPPGPPAVDPSRLPPFLRPPGALDEEAFLATCERCLKCRDACPHDVILPLGPAYRIGENTPAILPRGGPCRLCEDLPCAAACPSGALRVIPIAQVRMGTARLEASRCWSVRKQPCDYCVAECPLGERALQWDGDRPRILRDACAGCGMCAWICPTPEGAIVIAARTEGRGRTEESVRPGETSDRDPDAVTAPFPG